ncbi:MAG: helix-turn-helix transcriptional regulator [Crenarchaeota archaeon]|nr:helix-turn-helix transcriptional regulator [Thermoproteota archaeon]
MKKNRLERTQLRIYACLLEANKPLSVREIASAVGIAPSSVHYHLRRMIEAGLVKRTAEGFVVEKTINIEGYIHVGHKLLPRIMIYGFFFLGLSIGELTVMLLRGLTFDRVMVLMVSLLSSLLFFIEGVRIRRDLLG